jgi:hypothetical protein
LQVLQKRNLGLLDTYLGFQKNRADEFEEQGVLRRPHDLKGTHLHGFKVEKPQQGV